MEDHLKDFILNIFLIFSPLICYPYLHKFKTRIRTYQLLLYLILTFALITAMTFPVNLAGVVYDFRSVPLALGIIYGGPRIGFALFATAVMYRHLLDYPNTLLYAVSLLSAITVVVFCSRKLCSAASLYQKVILSIVFCSLIKLITFTIYFVGTNQLELLINQPVDNIKTYLLQGLIIGVCVYFIEFLDRHYQMEKELINKEKESIVSHIAASVAHEIRNPLTAVRGFIQLFGRKDLDADKRAFFQKMCLEELDRAERIITDYLTLAKPDPEVIEQIDINEEVHYISNVLEPYANLSNIQIIQETDLARSLIITGERNKFRQALINLGKNSIESMPNGGILEIKAEESGRSIMIQLKDTGTGMEDEQIQRLGTPFYSTKQKGTGLGTMVSYNIIKTMNGKIEIQSEVGKGTSTHLIFPSSTLRNR